jgi:antitoxin VapB
LGEPQEWYILISIMRTAKLFRNGRSQAVRLPKEFRFEGEEVNIRRAGKRVILEPRKRRQWPKGYWKSWGKVPDDFQAPEPLPAGPARAGFDGR